MFILNLNVILKLNLKCSFYQSFFYIKFQMFFMINLNIIFMLNFNCYFFLNIELCFIAYNCLFLFYIKL